MIAPAHSSFRGLIGVARHDITPPPGIYCRNWGAASHDAATGIHRPLTLTALSFQEARDSAPLVIVDADLGWFLDLRFAREFLRELREALGLEPEQFLFAMTHTHSAPPLLGEADPEWQGGELLSSFREKVRLACLEAVRCALANAEPALLEWHTGCCALAANRDLPMEGRFLVGYNPDVRADDTLLVGRMVRPDGSHLATMVNYACHPTTLAWENQSVSPDFLGAMRQTVEAQTGGAPAVFLQGASGDLAPREQYVGDPAVADRHGRQLGFAVLATLADMNPPGSRLVYAGGLESGATLACWATQPTEPSRSLVTKIIEVAVPLNKWPTAAELEEQLLACDDRAMAERIRRKLCIRHSVGDGPTFSIPLHICHIGNTLLCGTMTEAYSLMQEKLRSSFPDRTILWVNLLNGSLGYLVPSSHYDNDQYAVWQTPLGPGGFEHLYTAAHDAIAAFLHDQ